MSPFPKGSTIVFIGDSITHAHRRPEELHDCYYLGGGYVNRVMGDLGADYPQLGLRAVNRGECGHNTRDLLQRWQKDCLDFRPDAISLLTGINDSHDLIEPPQIIEEFIRNYRSLLTGARAALPAVRLVLVEPFGFSVAACPRPPKPVAPISPGHLANLPPRQAAVRHLAAEFGAVFVETQHLFDSALRLAPAAYWSLDGIHPSAAGHTLVARAWLTTVNAAGLLPA